MPRPVSLTTIRVRPLNSPTRTMTRPPDALNLMALATSLEASCVKRIGSPITLQILAFRLQRQLDAPLTRERLERANRAFEDGEDIARARVEMKRTCLDPCEIVEVADHLAHAVGGPRNSVEYAAGGAFVRRDRLFEKARPHDDRSEGVFQVMANYRNEVLLGLASVETCNRFVELVHELSCHGCLHRLGSGRNLERSLDGGTRLSQGRDKRGGHPRTLCVRLPHARLGLEA